MQTKLSKNVAIVTGASSGLGHAIAEELVQKGTRVIMVARGKKKLDAMVQEIKNNDGMVESRAMDVTDPKGVAKLISSIIKKYGRIDVVVNSAGWAAKKKPIEETSIAEYDRYMQTNTASIFYFMREVIPHMRRRRSGSIINIASAAAKRGHGGLAAYSASKFAVLGLTQSAGWELQNSGVTCIAICPGGIDTPMRQKIFGMKDASRQQKPAEVAKIILNIIEKAVVVPNGGDMLIRDGKVVSINDPLSS